MRSFLAIVFCMCVGLALSVPAAACDYGVQAVTAVPVAPVQLFTAPAFTAAYSAPVAFVNAPAVRERVVVERVKSPRTQRIKRVEKIRVR